MYPNPTETAPRTGRITEKYVLRDITNASPRPFDIINVEELLWLTNQR